jgi:hypothetical protein
MNRKNYEFWSSFIIFGDLENFLWISKEVILYEYFPIVLIKFANLTLFNSQTWTKFIQILYLNKFGRISIQTELDLNYIWINPMKIEKFTIPLGLTMDHGHSDPLDQGLAGWPRTAAFGRPMPSRAWSPHGAWPAHVAWRAHQCGTGVWTMTRSSPRPSTRIHVPAATQNPSRGEPEWDSHR